SKRVWHKVGHTKKGEDIYESTLGHFAVERDHMYLSEMTKQEMADWDGHETEYIPQELYDV
ncbi:MAG: hypothetical protein JRC60_07910, partial [Deltaproteobacteria bacterium]|nr:hypothetical protein [Deltaproteobacteria bacterium]